MSIKVKIEGAADSEADYSEAGWLANDAALRMAVSEFFDTGATIENIAEAVAGGLEDSGAAE